MGLALRILEQPADTASCLVQGGEPAENKVQVGALVCSLP